jgi:hypothetical protein
MRLLDSALQSKTSSSTISNFIGSPPVRGQLVRSSVGAAAEKVARK